MRTIADIADVALAFSTHDRVRAGIVADATKAMRSAERPADVEITFRRQATTTCSSP